VLATIMRHRGTGATPVAGEDTDRFSVSPRATGTPEVDLPPRDRPILTVLAGVQAGGSFALQWQGTIIGRSADCAVRIDDLGVSRHHACIVRTGATTFIIEDLGSVNGTFVEGRRVTRAELPSGARIHLGAHVELRFALVDAVEAKVAHELYASSTRDPLTGLHNRRAFEERLAHEVAYARRNHTPLGVLALDVDHFKHVNDTHGHAAGDALLVAIAKGLARAVREEDLIARIGGEEFAILTRGIEREGLRVLGERLRKTVERVAVSWEKAAITATVSIGVAALGDCTEGGPAEALVRLADAQVYAAKTLGRNRVCG
jgi:diguanylate cyclase (GGDEF)-like protein